MKEKETWLKIITKAWSEEAFKERLLKEPNKVLEEYHIKIPPGVTYEVLEDGVGGKHYLVLPPAPPEDGSLKIDNFGRDVQSGDPGF
jgi:hypothetical protein